MSERGIRGPEGEPGQDGRHGRDGANGIDGKAGAPGLQGDPGKDGRDGIDGKDGAKGQDGAPGEDGKVGARGPRGPEGPRGPAGKDGQDGQDGEMGPMPDHRWRGTELSFQQPDGSFGRYVDLRGPQGSGGLGGSGSGSVSKSLVLQVNTLLAIFGGWISTVPVVDITEVSIDGLAISATAAATGYYESIPGGEPVEASYEWDWGDGEMTVDELEAEHTYAEAGTYTISFRAKNHIGWSAPVSEEVTVSDDVPADPFWADVVLLVAPDGSSIIDQKGRHSISGIGEGDVTVVDNALMFPGDGALSIEDNLSDFAFEGEFTMEFWGSPSDASDDYFNVLDNFVDDGTTWISYLPPTGIGFYSSGERYFEGGETVVRGNGPHKFCWQKTGTSTQLFIDGQLIGEFPDGSAYASPGRPMVMGARANLEDGYYVGPIEGARITLAARYPVVDGVISQDTWPVPTN